MGAIAVTEVVPGFQEPLSLSERWVGKEIQVRSQVVELQ